jgi:hypothetical protein
MYTGQWRLHRFTGILVCQNVNISIIENIKGVLGALRYGIADRVVEHELL